MGNKVHGRKILRVFMEW